MHSIFTGRDHYVISCCPREKDDVNLHDTTGSSSTGVTSLQRVGVSTLSEIISTGVNNNSSANDGLGAKEGDVLVCLFSFVSGESTEVNLPVIWMEAFPDPSVLTFPVRQLGSKRYCRELTEITDVSLIVGWATVVLSKGVEVGSGRGTSVATDQLRFHDEVASLRVVSELAEHVSDL
jgi:hypothetical protein